MENQAAIILAAGKGTRMKSRKAKVLHEVAGAPMIVNVVREARKSGISKIVVVVGHQAAAVRTSVTAHLPHINVQWVLQTEQLGTAHAVKCAKQELHDFSGNVWILSGDAPLLSADLIRQVGEMSADSKIVVTSMTRTDPGSYGRIIRNHDGSLLAIREVTECSDTEVCISEVNAGLYRVDSGLLFDSLETIRPHNAQSEYYLTDIVGYAVSQGIGAVCAHVESRPEELQGVNTPDDLALVREFAKNYPEQFTNSGT